MRMFLVLIVMMMSSAFAMAQDNYGFKVAGVDVTSDNYLDLTEISGVSGKVYFDPNTRTLTLDNATIEVDGCNAILNKDCRYLVIELLGTNTINVTNSAGIYTCESTTIKGESGSKLSITNDRCAVLFEGSPPRDCQLLVGGRRRMGHISKRQRGRRGAHHTQLSRGSYGPHRLNLRHRRSGA